MNHQKESRFTSFFSNLNPLTLLFVLVLFVSVLTYVIPAGSYDRATDAATGKTIVVANTYHTVEKNPATPVTVMMSFVGGLERASSIIAFLLLIGGALGVIAVTGAIEAALGQIVGRFKSERSRSFIIAGVMFFFMFCSSTFGMGQEMMAFAPFIIVLMVSLGYDTVTAIASMILGYAVGYGSGVLNPFNLAVAQGITGLPYPSGMGYRIALSVVLYAAALAYLLHYAKKVRANPELSLSPQVPEEFSSKTAESVPMTGGHIRVWCIFAAGLTFLIWGTITQGFYLQECATIFLTMGLLAWSLSRLLLTFSLIQDPPRQPLPCLLCRLWHRFSVLTSRLPF